MSDHVTPLQNSLVAPHLNQSKPQNPSVAYKISLLLSPPASPLAHSAPAILVSMLFLELVKHTQIPEHLLFSLPETLLLLIST